MAKQELKLKMRAHIGPAMAALADTAADWPASKRNEFNEEWKRLQSAGAELLDSQMIDGVLVAYPSPDFTAHLEKWGIHLV